MLKRKSEILSLDKAIYMLMNGDFSDIELEDSDEEISENVKSNLSKDDEIQHEFNSQSIDIAQSISVGNKLIEIEVDDEQENVLEDAEHENQLQDDELELMELDDGENHEPACEIQESSMDKDKTPFLAETPVPKTTQEDSIRLFSSYVTSSNEEAMYDSSELNFSIMHQFRSPFLETPHLPTTPSLFIQSSHYSSSSAQNYAEEDDILISHQKSNEVSSSEDILSSYLLDHSSYLLEESLYNSRINKLLEDSYYLTKDMLLDFDSSSEEYLFPSETETIFFVSSVIGSNMYNVIEGSSNVISTNVDAFSPVAESRIHILSSINTPQLSTSFYVEEINTHTDFSSISDGLRIVEVSSNDATSELSEHEESELLEFVKENISPVYSKNTPAIHSLIPDITIGIQNISTAGSLKSKSQIASSTVITEQLSSKTISDKNIYTNDTNLSSYSELAISESETLKEANISHEIINDFNQPKNKTSRNEDPHLDDIISGIVHLLAGNVQLGRPGPNLFSTSPKRQNRPPPLHSTRINNRGPLSSTTFSRTVVVFSQPQNPGTIATEIARPVQYVPSAAGGGLLARPSDKNMQFIRIQPTKVGEKPPPGVSVIRFYHPGGKIPANNHGQPPFIGEIFTHNGVPLSPNVHLSNIPEGAFLNSLTEQIKMQNQKGNSEHSYPHFIFSDASGSSVLVVLSSLPSKIQTVGTFTTNSVDATGTTKIAPSKTFEVLADTSNPQNREPNVKPSNITNLKPSKDMGFKESSSGLSVKPTSVLNDSPSNENHTVPFGPVTDWVPFLERPSMKFKPSNINKTPLDEVSIIMQPIIFDITVSNSLNEIKISDNKTFENKSSKSTSTSILKNNERTSQSFLESSNLNTITTTDHKTPTYEVPNPQNVLTSKHISPSDENVIVMTPTTSIYKSEGIFTLQKLRTTLEKDESRNHKHTSTMKTDLLNSITSSQTLATRKAEDNLRLQNSYRTTTTLNTISSRTLGSVSSRTLNSVSSRTFGSPHSNIHSPLGRPIVIPVDIEEVRPFVGAINPINQDKSRGAYPSYGGTYPYPAPPVQVTRAGVNAREDFSTSSSTSPFQTSRTPIIRSQPRPRPNTIRIDTCIVGDDSTCDSKVNETCKTEFGISSCHCRPGYARSYTRGPCIPVVSIGLSLKIDRLGSRKISFSSKYLDKNSEEYRIMEFEAKQALTSLFSHTAFSRIFFGANVNLFYTIAGKLIVNSTVFLEEKESTRAQSVRLRLRQEIGESIKNRNQNIGESRLYVEGPLSPIINIEDVNECSDPNLNDCSEDGACLNVFGTFLCKCRAGYVDPLKHIERRSGRQCLACSPEYCTYHGQCFVERDQKLCKCQGNYIGSKCEIDGEVLGVALGASLAAIIIILLTLSCLCIWNRKWKKQQQKAEVLSARSYNSNQTFSYLSNMMNANANANAYQLTMEDRMRWAHISDVVKNASMQNQDCVNPYASTTLEQASFPTRYQHPNDKDPSWYDYRTRPRSRMLSHPGASPNATYYEMDSPARGPYMTSSCHSTKRYQNPNKMLRY